MLYVSVNGKEGRREGETKRGRQEEVVGADHVTLPSVITWLSRH